MLFAKFRPFLSVNSNNIGSCIFCEFCIKTGSVGRSFLVFVENQIRLDVGVFADFFQARSFFPFFFIRSFSHGGCT